MLLIAWRKMSYAHISTLTLITLVDFVFMCAFYYGDT